MVCVHCGSTTRVVNSRSQRRSNSIWRRRKCSVCTAVFTTEEVADLQNAWVVKNSSGKLSPFLRDRLMLSIYRSCAHRRDPIGDATALVDTVIGHLTAQVKNGSLETRLICSVTQVTLNRFDKVASVHYQAFHK